MAQSNEITRIVELAATGDPAGNDVKRCWDIPHSSAFRDITVAISTAGETTVAGNIDWEVLYGGVWDGAPFDTDSTHSGGISQGTGNVAGGAEVAAVIYEDASILPSNKKVSIPSAMGFVEQGHGGFPVVVELTNNKAAVVTVRVTFITRTASDRI